MTSRGQGFLFAADQTTGAYPPSWYAATANPYETFPSLSESTTADVCIIGGGYTGLSAALTLAERGMDVVLLEAHRIGWGASGRNGGQLGSGLNKEQDWLEKRLGLDAARAVWNITQGAKALVRDRVVQHEIACDLTPGVLHVQYDRTHTASSRSEKWKGADDCHAEVDHLRERYGYRDIEVVGPDTIQQHVGSPFYVGGTLDHGASHLHPLNLALGLGEAARKAGARIFELSPVAGYTAGTNATVQVNACTVTADAVILGCNAYLDDLEPRVARRVMPINNYIAATEPLDKATARELIPNNIAVADSNFVINYFHLSSDRRMLFGGGETYSYTFPSDIASLVRKPMEHIFPQLQGAQIDHAWGGTLAITSHRLPYFARLAPNVWTASGYSGNGVAMANMAGKILADVVGGTLGEFDVMASLPTRAFPGGSRFRHPLLKLAMTWYALRDKLGV